MVLLTNEQINLCCLHILNQSMSKDVILNDIFQNYYNTGLRANELLDLTRWSKNIDEDLVCDTEKGSNNRKFSQWELTPFFVASFLAGDNPYQYNSFSTVNLYFQRWLPCARVVTQNKNLGVCLFRHNKIKLMKDEGYSFEQIKLYFGEVELNNILGYYNSEIYADN
jgi:hypothetical protein